MTTYIIYLFKIININENKASALSLHDIRNGCLTRRPVHYAGCYIRVICGTLRYKSIHDFLQKHGRHFNILFIRIHIILHYLIKASLIPQGDKYIRKIRIELFSPALGKLTSYMFLIARLSVYPR